MSPANAEWMECSPSLLSFRDVTHGWRVGDDVAAARIQFSLLWATAMAAAGNAQFAAGEPESLIPPHPRQQIHLRYA
jgi:hypothetical protein